MGKLGGVDLLCGGHLHGRLRPLLPRLCRRHLLVRGPAVAAAGGQVADGGGGWRCAQVRHEVSGRADLRGRHRWQRRDGEPEPEPRAAGAEGAEADPDADRATTPRGTAAPPAGARRAEPHAAAARRRPASSRAPRRSKSGPATERGPTAHPGGAGQAPAPESPPALTEPLQLNAPALARGAAAAAGRGKRLAGAVVDAAPLRPGAAAAAAVPLAAALDEGEPGLPPDRRERPLPAPHQRIPLDAGVLAAAAHAVFRGRGGGGRVRAPAAGARGRGRGAGAPPAVLQQQRPALTGRRRAPAACARGRARGAGTPRAVLQQRPALIGATTPTTTSASVNASVADVAATAKPAAAAVALQP
mmetsp:Transcript_59863/g.174966  ORF Transcript_59863/g.174966 Transcript_59863/m.174966 type:complete len:359 (+) Transcript_59863:1210-2286(+)